MSKTEKTVERWRNATDENWATVQAVLMKYGFVLKHSRGSHFTYLHPALKAETDAIQRSQLSAFTAPTVRLQSQSIIAGSIASI